ncbi:MAG: cysteine desulfurase [Candidatus Melainabacteria bacterium]|nr:cysteine desulfurase [Candidatus Melainabacteria bacterium]
MTTSDPEGFDPQSAANFSGLPANPLDLVELTRIANEFMRAQPDLNVANAPLDVTATEVSKTSYGSFPSEADLRHLPSTVDLTGSGGTGFLSDIRPMLSAAQAFAQPGLSQSGLSQSGLSQFGSPQAALSQSGLPQSELSQSGLQQFGSPQSALSQSGLSQFGSPQSALSQSGLSQSGLSQSALSQSTLAGSGVSQSGLAPSVTGIDQIPNVNQASQIIGDGASLRSPQMPGAVLHDRIPFGESDFGFDQLRQIYRVDVIPTVEPMGIQNGGVPNLNQFSQGFDVAAIRRDFPILNEKVNGHNLVWLDNAATTQKPQSVIDRLSFFYEHENSNIHRAAHELAARSTDAYEKSRQSVQRFLNAPSVNDIVFVRGATEAINLVAQSWGRQNIRKDDEIVITWLEHHANIVPWQMLCAEKGARLKVAPVDDHGQILLDEYERLLTPATRLVALTQVSNALGTVTPVNEMVAAAHRYGAKVLVDGAQAVSHMRVDVQEYDCDFYVFSGHKLFAPTGIGVLYGKSELLNSMAPWQGGGNMIKDVTFERTTYNQAPTRFEAGTGNIADAVGLGAAIEYLERIGMVNITRHEQELMTYGTEALKSIPGLRLIGTAPEKAGVLSFVMDGFRTEEISSALNQQGIAVRAGHHCAQPILRRFGLESTVRPSLALYNTCEDIDALIAAIWNLKQGRSPGPL